MRRIPLSMWWGFGVGFVGSFLAILGLIFVEVEWISGFFLAPTRAILLPIGGMFEKMPGMLNILVFAVVNALVYALIFWAIAKIFGLIAHILNRP